MAFDAASCQNGSTLSFTTTGTAADGSVQNIVNTFTIQCGISYDYAAGVTPNKYNDTDSFQACINLCTDECIGVTGDYKSCTNRNVSIPFSVDPATNAGNVRWSAWKSEGPNAVAEPQVGAVFQATPLVATSSTSSVTDTSSTSATSLSTSTGSTTVSDQATSSTVTSATPSSSATSISNNGTSSSTGGKGSGGASAGVVAGAAVGAAIGAALLAFLVAFFLFGRRRRSRSESSGMLLSEKSPPAHPWESYLPQPADDRKIAGGVQTLLTQIDQHVENYYSNTFSVAEFDRSKGFLNMVDSGTLGTPLAQLLPEVTNALPIIKHSFAFFILGKLSPAGSPDETLLPAEYGRLPPKLAAARSKRGEDEAASQAYNYWRVLTAYLMYPNSASATHGDQLGPAGTQTIDVLTAAFAPWAKSSKAGQEHLKSVLKSATDTGLLVLSQSSSFTFAWDVLRNEDGREVVVSPAFVKTADEHGQALVQRQVLVKPKVESI